MWISKHIVPSRDFGAAEIDVFITEFGLDIQEWNLEKEEETDKESDDEVVDCNDVSIAVEEGEQSEDPRPLSGKQARNFG